MYGYDQYLSGSEGDLQQRLVDFPLKPGYTPPSYEKPNAYNDAFKVFKDDQKLSTSDLSKLFTQQTSSSSKNIFIIGGLLVIGVLLLTSGGRKD